MPTSSILQIGDIHYPSHKGHADVDNKLDARSTVLNGVGVNRFAAVLTAIRNLSKSVPIDFAVFVGDFTDAGNQAEFENALKYFATAFKAMGIASYGVPGNHDLEWPKLLDPATDKFSAFSTISQQYKSDIEISFEDIQTYERTTAIGEVSLYAMNSCLGCSDIWKMSKLYEVDIERHLKSVDASQLFSRFDAPYIDVDALTKVCQEIKGKPACTPIILAHHNILPQRTPRIAIFPEMLNAGYVRSELNRLGRPIIYLHGHIHHSLVETLLDHEDDAGQIGLVAISAPLLRDGFNHVQLFSTDEHIPLGVQIDQYILDTSGEIHTKRRRIRFYGSEKQNDLLDDSAREILDAIKSTPNARYNHLTKQFAASKILELEFTGHLKLTRTIAFSEATWRVNI